MADNNKYDMFELIDLDKEDIIESIVSDSESEDDKTKPLIDIDNDKNDWEVVDDTSFRTLKKIFNKDKKDTNSYIDKYRSEGLYLDPYVPTDVEFNGNEVLNRNKKISEPNKDDVSKSEKNSKEEVNNSELDKPASDKQKLNNQHVKKAVSKPNVDYKNLYNAKYSVNNKSSRYIKHAKNSLPYSYEREKARVQREAKFKQKEKLQRNKIVRDYLIAIAIGFIVAKTILGIFHPVLVSGSSMEPSFSNGDWVLCETDFHPETLSRGDVVVFTRSGRTYIKRIVALPGDSIEIVNGHLYINGEDIPILDFDDIENPGILEDNIKILDEDEYFCMGDNRNNSTDCRDFGPISFYNIDYVVERKIFN